MVISVHEGKNACFNHRGWSDGAPFRVLSFLVSRCCSLFKKEYAIINLETLDSVFNDGDAVSLDVLVERGIIRKELNGLKVLGRGEITKKLTVKAAIFSASAKEKIEAAGGKAEVI